MSEVPLVLHLLGLQCHLPPDWNTAPVPARETALNSVQLVSYMQCHDNILCSDIEKEVTFEKASYQHGFLPCGDNRACPVHNLTVCYYTDVGLGDIVGHIVVCAVCKNKICRIALCTDSQALLFHLSHHSLP